MKFEEFVGRTKNPCEVSAAKILIAKGYKVYRKGWPDFMAVHSETGDIVFVEVKRKNKPRNLLSGAQLEVCKILSKHFRYYLACFNSRGEFKKAYKQ